MMLKRWRQKRAADRYRAHLAAGGEGILTRASRELVEMGLATQAPSPLDGMTEVEKRAYRAKIYREVAGT